MIASWFTFQRCPLTNVAVGLAPEHINLAPRVQSQVESWPGIRGVRCHPGCEQAPNGFSQARGRLQQEPELFCPVGSSSPLSRGKLFYCTLPAVRVRFKWRGSARNASWTSCWWGIPWGTMGAPPRYYPQLGGAHRQHGVVVRHLFYTWTPPCLVCRAQGCYSRGC